MTCKLKHTITTKESLLNIGKIGRNSGKRNQYKQRKTTKTNKQQKIQEKTYENKEDLGSGEQITSEKEHGNIRIYLQNPNGLSKEQDTDNLVALQDIADWKTDVVGLPECRKDTGSLHT